VEREGEREFRKISIIGDRREIEVEIEGGT
jgi:hypothetical protein